MKGVPRLSVWGEHCPSVLHSKIHYVLKKVNNPTLQLNHHGKSQTSTARLIQACNGNERSSFLFSVHSTVHATGRAVGLRSDRAFCRPTDRPSIERPCCRRERRKIPFSDPSCRYTEGNNGRCTRQKRTRIRSPPLH